VLLLRCEVLKTSNVVVSNLFGDFALATRCTSSLFELNSARIIYLASELLSLPGYFAILLSKISYLACNFVLMFMQSSMEWVRNESCAELLFDLLFDKGGSAEYGKMSKLAKLDMQNTVLIIFQFLISSIRSG